LGGRERGRELLSTASPSSSTLQHESTDKTEGREEVIGSEMPFALLYIDHMRDTKGYIGCLESFCSECQVQGILRPSPRGSYDLLLLSESAEGIKRWVSLLKTTKIDVDSKGKRCKEKQSRVLLESKANVSMTAPTLKVIAVGEDLVGSIDDGEHIRLALKEVMKSP
jgi:hypothetical protein